MKNLRILNIVFIECGILSTVTSFIVTEENETEQVKKAEELFLSKISEEVDLSEDDKEEVLDNGYFDEDGIYYALEWSTVVGE